MQGYRLPHPRVHALCVLSRLERFSCGQPLYRLFIDGVLRDAREHRLPVQVALALVSLLEGGGRWAVFADVHTPLNRLRRARFASHQMFDELEKRLIAGVIDAVELVAAAVIHAAAPFG